MDSERKRRSGQQRDDGKIEKDRAASAPRIRKIRGAMHAGELREENAAAAKRMRAVHAKRKLEVTVSDSAGQGKKKSGRSGSKSAEEVGKERPKKTDTGTEWSGAPFNGHRPHILSKEELISSEEELKDLEIFTYGPHGRRYPRDRNAHSMDIIYKSGVWEREPFINIGLANLFRRVSTRNLTTIVYLRVSELTELFTCLATYLPGLSQTGEETADDMFTDLLPLYDRFLCIIGGKSWPGFAYSPRKHRAHQLGPVLNCDCGCRRIIPPAHMLGCACTVEEGRASIKKMGRCPCMEMYFLSIDWRGHPDHRFCPGNVGYYSPCDVKALLFPAENFELSQEKMGGDIEWGGYFLTTDAVFDEESELRIWVGDRSKGTREGYIELLDARKQENFKFFPLTPFIEGIVRKKTYIKGPNGKREYYSRDKFDCWFSYYGTYYTYDNIRDETSISTS